MPVRVGVIGVGIMGAEHARLLSTMLSGSEVSAVFDIAEARAKQVAAACGARVLDDPMVLIKEEIVDAIVVASSDATHEQLVLACIAAGKPVLCEKPLAPSTDACRRILAAEGAHGSRLVTVGFMRRFDAGYRAMRARLEAGAIGEPLLLHCVHRNAAAPGMESPVLISGSAVHEIDIARWLLADDPVAITVLTPRSSSRAGGAQDPMLLIVEMRSGVLVDVEVFVNAGYGYEVRAELVGDSGTVSIDAQHAAVHRSAGSVSYPVDADWRARFAEAYRRELQDWVDAVAAGTTPAAATAWDGYVATAVAEAGVVALETGHREPVAIAERPALYS